MGTEGPQSEPRQPRKPKNHVCRPVGYGAAGRRSASGHAHGSGPHSGQRPWKSLMRVASKCHRAYVGAAEDEGCWRRVCAGSPPLCLTSVGRSWVGTRSISTSGWIPKTGNGVLLDKKKIYSPRQRKATGRSITRQSLRHLGSQSGKSSTRGWGAHGHPHCGVNWPSPSMGSHQGAGALGCGCVHPPVGMSTLSLTPPSPTTPGKPLTTWSLSFPIC